MWIFKTITFGCLLVLVSIPAIAQAGKSAQKWEYGELRHHERAGTFVAPNKEVFIPAVEWISGHGFVRGYGWEGMADKLKAPALKKDAIKDAKKDVVEAIQRVRVLNHLGAQGWEMISYERNQQTGMSLWIFKRRIGK